MRWLTDWRRRRVLAKHRMDDALWRAQRAVSLPAGQRQAAGDDAAVPRGEGVRRRADLVRHATRCRVSIGAQACLPGLELGLDWYRAGAVSSSTTGDFRVRREEIDEHGVCTSGTYELAGEAMPGGPSSSPGMPPPTIR